MLKNTGIRLDSNHFKKLDALKEATGLRSRNAVVVQLIEDARLIELREVVVHSELVATPMVVQHAT